MEIILLEKVRNLGNLGDKVNVKSGYGRNFLIPQGKAVFATAGNTEKFELRRAELEQKAAASLDVAKERVEQLNTLSITVAANASDEGKLFGSVGVNEISVAATKAGHTIERSEINLPEGPFHQVGEYTVAIQVHSDAVAHIKVTVVAAK